MIVCSSACPTCSEPVTLGGGITIENVGRSSCGPGSKTPASTQPAYRRSSTDDGEYVVGRSGRDVGSVMAESLGSARAWPRPATAAVGSGDARPKLSDRSDRLLAMSAFSDATAVRAAGDGRFDVDLHPDWSVGGRPNGGYLLSIMARAAVEAAGKPHPLAVSAHFLAPPSGGPGEISTELMREGRRVSAAARDAASGGHRARRRADHGR